MVLDMSHGTVEGEPRITTNRVAPRGTDTVFTVVAVLVQELREFQRNARHEVVEAMDGVVGAHVLVVGGEAELHHAIVGTVAILVHGLGESLHEHVLALDDGGLDTVILLHVVAVVRGRGHEHDEADVVFRLHHIGEFHDARSVFVVVVAVGGMSVAHVGVWFWVWVSFQPAGSP